MIYSMTYWHGLSILAIQQSVFPGYIFFFFNLIKYSHLNFYWWYKLYKMHFINADRNVFNCYKIKWTETQNIIYFLFYQIKCLHWIIVFYLSYTGFHRLKNIILFKESTKRKINWNGGRIFNLNNLITVRHVKEIQVVQHISTFCAKAHIMNNVFIQKQLL